MFVGSYCSVIIGWLQVGCVDCLPDYGCLAMFVGVLVLVGGVWPWLGWVLVLVGGFGLGCGVLGLVVGFGFGCGVWPWLWGFVLGCGVLGLAVGVFWLWLWVLALVVGFCFCGGFGWFAFVGLVALGVVIGG